MDDRLDVAPAADEETTTLVRDGHQTTSSGHLGSLLGFTDAQVRKDLAYFGHFGYPGIGYRCEELIQAIRHILGTDKAWSVAMVGVGNLGRALLGYRGFGNQNFRIVAAFDLEAERIGPAKPPSHRVRSTAARSSPASPRS